MSSLLVPPLLMWRGCWVILELPNDAAVHAAVSDSFLDDFHQVIFILALVEVQALIAVTLAIAHGVKCIPTICNL